ncbi:hypothetical protein ACFLT7_07510 [candidate division KSB1 bacterium]
MNKFYTLLLPLFLLLTPAEAKTVQIESKELRATLDLATMAVDVYHKAAKVTWEMSRDGAKEFVYELNGEIHEVSLADSKDKRITRLGEGACLITLADFRLDLLLRIDETSGELVFKLIPLEEDHQFTIKGIIYPRPFLVPIRSDCYSFFPAHQGILIPGDWDRQEDINAYYNIGGEEQIEFDDEDRMKTFGELMNRPYHWWDFQGTDQAGLVTHSKLACLGAVVPGSGFIAIIDPDCQMDTYTFIRHIPGKPTDYKVYWRPSMGKLGYPRTISYHFEKDGGYVSLIKYFRRWVGKLGYLKTLEEKNRENPDVEKLKGAVNLRTRVSRHDNRNFQHEIYYTFHEIGEQVAEFKERVKTDRAAISFTGWQRYGHDQEYPDIMPPMMYAGGPLGLDSLSTKVQELGYLFGLSTDNYCDITLDAASFDEEVTLKDSQGKYFRRSTWAAGVNSLICPRWAIRFLRRNFEVGRTDYPPVLGLLETAHPNMYFLGNYVCNWECYDPRHPLTRNENKEALREIFEYFQEKDLLFSIEHPMDWTVPYLVRASTRTAADGNYGRNEGRRTRGVPIPLWQMVFHDCAYVSGGGLYGFLWGAPASLGLPLTENDSRIEDTLLMAKLHRAIGWDEMTDHKFLSDDFLVQETTFSSGAKVWVDFDKNSFRISGVPGIDSGERRSALPTVGRD